MPNHFHGIIVIGENQYNNPSDNNGDAMDDECRIAMHCDPTFITNKPKNQFGPQSKNLASIIRGFKIGVTKNARFIHPDFAWQSRFYDHIIRNNESHQRIANYIKNNPTNWKEDKWY
ncbi:MAG: hypothetical protein WD530_07315 [Vicingaceae bacterium]